MATSNAASSRKPARPPKIIQVHFATNRNETGDKNHPFGSDFRNAPDGSLYVTGTINVYRRSGSRRPNWEPHLDSLVLDPPTAAASSIPQAVAAAPSTSDAMTAFIEDRGAPKEKLVFLPGFAHSFCSAMSNSAQIASTYGAKVFCFSWPSQGKFGLEYFIDQISALRSGPAIAHYLSRLFSKLLSMAKSTRPNLNIVCHSMGNRALSAAIQIISVSAPKLLSTNYFEYALLMAADEDNDALDKREKLKRILTLATNIDVYTNENDFAMFLSLLANGQSPLGWFGPADFGKLPKKVISIDCTEVGDTYENDGSTNWGHQYFRNSEPVTGDAHQVLLGITADKVVPRNPVRPFPKKKFKIPA
jgi:esterase/lipase superfamily enzyme